MQYQNIDTRFLKHVNFVMENKNINVKFKAQLFIFINRCAQWKLTIIQIHKQKHIVIKEKYFYLGKFNFNGKFIVCQLKTSRGLIQYCIQSL